jgi:hypothetical protein
LTIELEKLTVEMSLVSSRWTCRFGQQTQFDEKIAKSNHIWVVYAEAFDGGASNVGLTHESSACVRGPTEMLVPRIGPGVEEPNTPP